MSNFKPVNISEIDHNPIAQPVAAQRRLPQDEHDKLFAVAGVMGYGFATEDGADTLVVYIREGSDQNSLPQHIDGLAVRAEIVGVVSTQ